MGLHLSVLQANIRLQYTNGLAYLASSSLMTQKVFIILAPGVDWCDQWYKIFLKIAKMRKRMSDFGKQSQPSLIFLNSPTRWSTDTHTHKSNDRDTNKDNGTHS